MVELQFKENPPRTPRAAYRVRLVREKADLGGATQNLQRAQHEKLRREKEEMEKQSALLQAQHFSNVSV